MILLILVQPLSVRAELFSPAQQTGQQAQALLDTLTAEQKIGQLFLVTFSGATIGPESPIRDLIRNHHIGGVVLLAGNENFAPGGQALNGLVSLNRQIQLERWTASQESQTHPATGESFTPAFIPLFIGLQQEGDGFPYDQLLDGLTPLPSQMAIGATWNPDMADQVGSVLGEELSLLGINLLLGPSLDVLESPHLEGGSDLGIRSFGGDPFWVGEMGRAYIRGVHQGSAGRLAVVAKHFPGHGSSDRLPEEEVSTVRKSPDQLNSFDLVPFFAVTGNADSPESTADALLASHIRIQGFQGNIRATTRPISFDPQAFQDLISLPPLDAWRKNGGMMVSDNLGSQAVRRYYDLTNQAFDARRVTLNAFQAGNDLLYVADFSSANNPDSYIETVRTLEFFTQKYNEDPAFAQRVDESVLRILTLKYRLYTDFTTLSGILPDSNKLAEVGHAGQTTFEVAREAATLISPTQSDLADTMPDPPNGNDRIVFMVDDRQAQQCAACQPFPLLDLQAFQRVVLRRYGPSAGGQVSPNNLSSYSLETLRQMLDSELEPDGPGAELESDLTGANWIVFAMLNASPQSSSFDALSRFLTERPDLFQQKRLLVFAFGGPYYLDATNISKLTAYYALYSKAPQFIDVAAYLLFRDYFPGGALPVSVPGAGYDLNTALFPDPNQVIPLIMDIPQPESQDGNTTPEPPPLPDFRIGDTIPVRTGVIYDGNGNPVPDGTPVEFVLTLGGEASGRQTTTTTAGVARSTFPVTTSGMLEIRAESETAQSEPLRFDIPAPNGEVAPPTITPTMTPTQTPTPTPTVTPLPVVTDELPPPSRPQIWDWVMAILITGGMAWSFYRLAALIGQERWGVRGGFLGLIGGLLAYSYLALQLPGTDGLLSRSISRGVFLTTLSGTILGLIAAWSWRTILDAIEKNGNSTS